MGALVQRKRKRKVVTYFHRAAGVGVCLGPPASTLGLRAQWRRSIYAFTAPLRRVRDRIQTRRKGAQSSQAQSRSHRCRHRLLEVALFRMKKYILLINFILLFPLACSFPTCQNAAKLVQRETQQMPHISIQRSRGFSWFCSVLWASHDANVPPSFRRVFGRFRPGL